MRDIFKRISYVAWGSMSLIGIFCGVTEFIFYNILIFPLIGALTFYLFPQSYLKWIAKLLFVNFLVSIFVFFFNIQGNFIGVLLTGLMYTGFYMVLNSLGMIIFYLFKTLFNQRCTNSRRTLSGIVATALLALIFQSSLQVLGNPLTVIQATSTIESYVEQKYEHSLIVKRAKYDRVSSEYVSRVYSKEQVDLYFDVVYASGLGVITDTYELDVLSFQNTLKRLAEEYTKVVTSLVSQELALKNLVTKVWYDSDGIELKPEILSLGMEFDEGLPLAAGVLLGFEMEDDSLVAIAEKIEQIYQLFEQRNHHFDLYSITVTVPMLYMLVEELLPRDIGNGTLKQLLEAAEIGGINTLENHDISIKILEK